MILDSENRSDECINLSEYDYEYTIQVFGERNVHLLNSKDIYRYYTVPKSNFYHISHQLFQIVKKT